LPIDLEEQCTDEMEVLLRRSLMMFAFAESKKKLSDQSQSYCLSRTQRETNGQKLKLLHCRFRDAELQAVGQRQDELSA
jgi:hypothetical protein